MFDGKIASTMKRTKQEKRFGVQIDSLSDLICFGALPALIVLQYSGKTPLHIAISAIYLLCALIRLAWFNVDEEERQDNDENERKAFRGLPVTTAAVLLPIFIGTAHIIKKSTIAEKTSPWILLCIAIAFLTPFSMKKPGIIGKILLLLFGIAGLAAVLIGVRL